MKKALLSLLFAAIFMPFVMAQDNANRVIVATNETSCQSYTWAVNGVTYTADTVVTYLNATNDTLFVLNLTINRPGSRGYGQVVVEDCSYLWHGKTITASGSYCDTILGDGHTCDSLFIINLQLTGTKVTRLADSACGQYVWHGDTLTESGAYGRYDSTLTCPQLDSLFLSIVTQMPKYDTIYNCGKYTWGDTVLTATGNYTHLVIDTVSSCDTLKHLNFNMTVDTARRAETKTSCGAYSWYGQNYDTTGVYATVSTDQTTLCQTYRTLDLTVIPQRVSEIDTVVKACGSFNFTREDSSQYNRKITSDTSFSYRMIKKQTNNGGRFCYDSTVHMTVHIKTPTTVDTTVKACDSFYWDRKKVTYTTVPETAPKFSLGKDTNGCDSSVVLQLTLRKAPVISAINGEWRIAEGGSTHLYPTCTPGAAYLWHYGNETATEDTLFVENVHGNLDVDLVATLTYTDINFACHDTSWITIVTYVGIDEAETANVSLYPNPAVGQLNVECAQPVSQADVFNTLGQRVLSARNLGTKGLLSLSGLAKGTYTIRLTLEGGETVIRKIILAR